MAGPYSAGSIFLQIVPSFRGVPEAIAAEAKTWEKVTSQAGADGGKGYAKGFEKEISKGIPGAIDKATKDSSGSSEKAGKDAGKKYGGAFQESIRQAVKDAQREVQATIKVTADDKDVKKTLAAIGGELKALGKAKIGINMSAEDAYGTLAVIEGMLQEVQKEAKRLDLEVNSGAATAAIEKIRERIDSLTHTDVTPNIKADDRQLSAFETKIRTALQAALRDLPAVDVNANTGGAEAQLTALRALMEELSNAHIGVEVDAATAHAVLADIKAELDHLSHDGATIDVRFNAATALERVAALKAELDAIAHPTIEPQVKENGTFARSIKAAVDGALKDLPEYDLKVTGDAAEREIARIRQELQTLSGQTVGVDISDADAVTKLGELRARLQQLSSEHWGAQVDVDTLAAKAKLDSVLATMDELRARRVVIGTDADTARTDAALIAVKDFADRLDGKHAVVHVEVDGAAQAAAELEAVGKAADKSAIGGQDGANAFRAFNGYLLAGAALGPALVPMLAAVGGGAAALGPMAVAGATGIGVLAMSMSGISAAVKAMGAAQKSATSDQLAYDKGVQSSTNAMITAQEGLDTARRNAGRAAEDSARTVATAVLAEQRAEEQAAETSRKDNQQVADAIVGVASAREQAALSAQSAQRQVEQADRDVESAERTLQSAQEDAQRAQENLTQARRDAADQQKDLALQVRDSALDQQQALINLHEAQAALAAGQAKGLAGDDLLKLQIAVQRYTLTLDQAKQRSAELDEKTGDWAKTGIEGSAGVVSAQDKIKQSTQGIKDAQQGLTDAQQKAADARAAQARDATDSQRSIAAAERSLADAERQRAQDGINSQRSIAAAQQQVAVAREQQQRAAEDGQRAISDAQRNLTQAQLAYQDSLQKTSSSQRNLNDAMDALGPAGQSFAKYIFGYLIPAFRELRDVSAEGMLPGFQSWIDTIVGHYGPQLIQIVSGMSGAVGHMFEVFGQTLLTKPFADLFNMIQNDGPTFIGMMATVLSNIGSGVASLITAMQPLAYLFGDWLMQASGAFKEWAANLGSSSGLQKFFEYVRQVGPEVADFFKALGGAIGNLIIALAPYGEQLMNVFTSILNWVAGMDPGTLGRIALGIIGIVGAIQGMFAATAAIKSVESAFKLATVASDKFGFSVGKIASGAALMGGGVAVLFQTSQTFRDTVGYLVTEIGNLLGSIRDAMPWLGSLAGVLATAAGSFMAFKGLGNIIGGIGSAAGDAAPKVGVMVEKLTGSATQGERAMTAMGKFGGVLSGFSRALPYVGIVIGLITTAMEAHSREIDNMAQGYLGWYEAMGQGGTAADQAAGKMRTLGSQLTTLNSQYESSKNSVGGMYIGLQNVNGQYEATVQTTGQLKAKHDDLAAALKKAQDQWQAELDKMGPVQRAQALMNQAIAEHGTNSDQARAQVDAYRGAVDAQRASEDNAAWAIDGVNNALIRQNDILLAGAQSELAYQQSVDNLTDAHQRSKDALDKYGKGSDEYRRALLQEQVQALQTAQAAGEHEKSLHQGSDTATQNALAQAALYQELERQKQKYGELAPAQEQMRANLEKTVTQAQLAQVNFDNLGLAIVGVPDDKTIDVASTSPEVEKQLTDLGVHVTHMPDGTVRLTGDTQAAEDLLNATARDRKSTVWQEVKMLSMDQANSSFGANLGHNWDIGGHATGGYLRGPGTGTSDSILARVSNGEYVVRAAAVDHYGVGLLDALNSKAFATGGLVGRDGLPAFAGGGLVANWGGTVDLTGGNVAPLAQVWADAVRDITAMSGLAAQSVGKSFGAMRDGALGATGDLNSGIAGQWGQIAGVINTGALNAQTGATGQFRVLQANADSTFRALNGSLTTSWGSTVQVLNGGSGQLQTGTSGQLQVLQANANTIFGQMGQTLPASWNAMGDQLNIKTQDTQVRQVGWFTGLRDNLTLLTGQTRDNVSIAWNTMGDNVNIKTGDTKRIVEATWGGMGADVGQNSRDTVNAVGRAFAGIQPAVQNPVDFVVNNVLNKGLYPAFNAVSSAVALPNVVQSVVYHPAQTNNTPIYAATGGQVPGWSPHDKADNIPAWLTAGEFVHPVQTVDYYGTDIMDAIRKRKISKESLAAVRYADGGYVGPRQPYAAGGFTWPELDSIRKKMFPGSVLTSAYRPGANDYHGAGEAIDIGWAGNDQRHLMPIAAALAQTFPNATELIHNPNGSIKNGQPVSPGFWGAPTWAAHANHVHWAMTPAALGGAPGGGVAGSIFNPMLGGQWGSADEVHNYLANSFAAPNAAVTGSPLHDALRGIGPKDLQIGWDGPIGNGVRDWFAQAAAMASNGSTDPAPVAPGPVQDMVRAVFGQYGWNSGPQWDAASWIVGKESGWRPNAQNPVSSASGLFQQVDGTWRANRPPSAMGYAHMKDAPVPLQAGAGAAYMRNRYGSPIAARSYWQAHGNYARGGLVVPELHDAGLGGVIHPGLNMIVNKTRKAEASVSMATIDNLRTIAEGGQAPLVGSVNLPLMGVTSPGDVADEVLHAIRVVRRGGRHP